MKLIHSYKLNIATNNKARNNPKNLNSKRTIIHRKSNQKEDIMPIIKIPRTTPMITLTVVYLTA